jgi:hypothetical protein
MREDLSAFFADFATTVRLPSGRTVKAIVDAPFVGVGEPAAVESAAVSLFAQTADVRDVEFGDILEFDGVDHTVRGVEPDGLGMTVLRLEIV